MKIKKLVEEINNFDNIKDPKVVLDPVTGDAIETSKKTQDTFDKVATPFKKPIKGTKDDEKSKAADLKESFSSDGWELEDSSLSEVLSKLSDLKYEIDNCVRGSYATHGIDKYGELAIFVRDLADDLMDCAYELADMALDEDEDEDMDESLNERLSIPRDKFNSLEDYIEKSTESISLNNGTLTLDIPEEVNIAVKHLKKYYEDVSVEEDSDTLGDPYWRINYADLKESLTEEFEFTNGSLEDFDPQDLMDKVKERKMSLFTSREFNNKLYHISIHPHGRVDQPSDIWVDIVEEDENGNQERPFLKKYNTYEEAVNAMKEWKDMTIQNHVETLVDEALREDNNDPMDSKLSDKESDIQLIMWYFGVDHQKAEKGLDSGFYNTEDVEKARKYYNKKSNPILDEDGRQSRVDLTPEQKADEKAMAETLFDKVYNELEKDTDGSKNIVNKKASQRYNTEDLSTDVNGNIVVYAPEKDKLQNAINVAEAYKLKYKVGPGSIRNKAHAFQCVIFIPEEE